MKHGEVYLIPTVLAEDGFQVLPAGLAEVVRSCQAFFVENERTARRFLRKIWKEMVIDDYRWYAIDQAEEKQVAFFLDELRQGHTVGILSEAGCPGIADPGQVLVAAAQKAGMRVRPVSGPSSILLALMASGLNGQQFRFNGYLPIEASHRSKVIRELESESAGRSCTQIFIETPYRNNQLLDSLLKTLQPRTMLCIASELTSAQEQIMTRSVADWKKEIPDLHKKPAIFLFKS